MAIMHSDETGSPLGDPVEPIQKAIRTVALDMPQTFDDSVAGEVLALSVDELVSSSNLLLKSMYEFDLDSEEGVVRLISLLPILDPEILKTVLQEIWPGADVDSLTFDNSLARSEIKGYLLDFLGGHGTKAEDIDSRDEGEPDGGAEGPEAGPEQDGALKA